MSEWIKWQIFKVYLRFNKARLYKGLIATTNYIVITDKINDGYVEPQFAEAFLEQLEPIMDSLKLLARDYKLGKQPVDFGDVDE